MAQIVNVVRVLHNLKHGIDTGLSEEEMAIVRQGLGYEPASLKEDKGDLVNWWERGII